MLNHCQGEELGIERPGTQSLKQPEQLQQQKGLEWSQCESPNTFGPAGCLEKVSLLCSTRCLIGSQPKDICWLNQGRDLHLGQGFTNKSTGP